MIDPSNYAGLVFTDSGTVRIRRGEFLSFSYRMNLITPVDVFLSPIRDRVCPEYAHEVTICRKRNRDIEFSARNVSGYLGDEKSRIMTDITPNPVGKVKRVLIWKSRLKPVTRVKPSEPN